MTFLPLSCRDAIRVRLSGAPSSVVLLGLLDSLSCRRELLRNQFAVGLPYTGKARVPGCAVGTVNRRARNRPRVRLQVVWLLQLSIVNSAAIVTRSGGVGIHFESGHRRTARMPARSYSQCPYAVNKSYTNPALYIQVGVTDLWTSPELPQWNPPVSSVTLIAIIPV